MATAAFSTWTQSPLFGSTSFGSVDMLLLLASFDSLVSPHLGCLALTAFGDKTIKKGQVNSISSVTRSSCNAVRISTWKQESKRLQNNILLWGWIVKNRIKTREGRGIPGRKSKQMLKRDGKTQGLEMKVIFLKVSRTRKEQKESD